MLLGHSARCWPDCLRRSLRQPSSASTAPWQRATAGRNASDSSWRDCTARDPVTSAMKSSVVPAPRNTNGRLPSEREEARRIAIHARGCTYGPADLTKAVEHDRTLLETVAYIRSPHELPAVIAEVLDAQPHAPTGAWLTRASHSVATSSRCWRRSARCFRATFPRRALSLGRSLAGPTTGTARGCWSRSPFAGMS